MIPTTPLEYLSSSGPGTGQSAATSSWSRRRTAGDPERVRPMSTTVSTPQACSVGARRCTGFATEKVTVSSAKTPSGSRTSPDGSCPEGRSTAMTWAPSGIAATQARAQSGRPGRAPMPSTPSSTTSASATASASVVRTTPASRAAASAPSWTMSWCTAAVRWPSAARRATAYRASAPLLPGPTRATTDPAPCSASRAVTTPASPSTARSISSPSARVSIRAASAA